MKYLFSLLFFIALNLNLFAQTNNKKAFSLELLGRTGLGSIHYEHKLLRSNKLELWGTVGLSTVRLFDPELSLNPDLLLPFGFIFNSNQKHGPEFMLGSTFSSIPIVLNNRRENNFSLNSSLGYRYNLTAIPLYFSASYQFIYVHFSTIRHWGGVRIGYTF